MTASRVVARASSIEVQATTQTVHPKLTRNSMLKDFQNHPKGNAFYPQLLEASGMDIPSESDAPSPEETAEKRKLRMFVLGLPGEMLVRKLPAFSQGKFTDEQLDRILQPFNRCSGAVSGRLPKGEIKQRQAILRSV